MSTFRAQVSIDDGTLHVSRPLLAPEPVSDMIDSIVWTMQQPEQGGRLLSVELVVEAPGESETPVGDSIASTTSTPLDDEPEPVLAARS